MSGPEAVNTEQWAKFGTAFLRFQKDGPGIHSAKALVKAADNMYHFSEAKAVLDIGCGTGTVIREVIDKHASQMPHTSRILASDLSLGMIEQVRQQRQQEILDGNAIWSQVETAVHDAADLRDIPDNSFSHVLSGFTIFLLKEHRRALIEIRRILDNGGVFAMTSMGQATWVELMQFVSTIRPEKSIPQPLPKWRTVDGVREELQAAGFVDVEVHTEPISMPFEDHEEIVRYLTSTLPFMSLLTADMTEEEKSRANELMVQHLKHEYPTLPNKLPGIAVVGVGRKRV